MFYKPMLNGSLEDLLRISDETVVLWRGLLQELSNQGGSTENLEWLLKDVKGDRKLIIQFARLLIGPIWDMVGHKLDIGEVDFDCPILEFLKMYPSVRILPGAIQDHTHCYTEDKPVGKRLYTLAHFPKYVTQDSVLKSIEPR